LRKKSELNEKEPQIRSSSSNPKLRCGIEDKPSF